MRRLHVEGGTDHGDVAQAELLSLQKSGQFPDELVKIEGEKNHNVKITM